MDEYLFCAGLGAFLTLVVFGVLTKDSFELANNGFVMIAECEAKLPRDVKCILVAKPE